MNDKRSSETGYRAQIYQSYGYGGAGQSETMNPAEVDDWGKAYTYYLRGWLPANRDAIIVDVGCGTGRLLTLFKKLGYRRISGVDISPRQVAISRQVIEEVYERDILEYLEESQNTFDLIVGLDVIEHFQKREVLRFLELSLKSLKPSGRIILQTPNAESPWAGTYRYGDFTHEIGLTSGALDGLLRLSGFVGISVREAGPIPLGYSPISSLRYALWQIIRTGLKVWNLAETGGVGSKIFTRNFLISAQRL